MKNFFSKHYCTTQLWKLLETLFKFSIQTLLKITFMLQILDKVPPHMKIIYEEYVVETTRRVCSRNDEEKVPRRVIILKKSANEKSLMYKRLLYDYKTKIIINTKFLLFCRGRGLFFRRRRRRRRWDWIILSIGRLGR